MSNTDTDILQIRKYLNGELDAKAMHQLERRAQDDPFLMDALEGYEKAGKNQEPQLNDINHRLQQRIAKKPGRVIPWKITSIAASIIAILTIGGLWINNRNADKPQEALVIKPAVRTAADTADDTLHGQQHALTVAAYSPKVKQVKKLTSQVKTHKPVIINTNADIAMAVAEVKSPDAADKDTEATPLNEQIVMGYSAQKKTAPEAVAALRLRTDQLKNIPASPALNEIMLAKANKLAAKNVINGKVVGKDDQLPITGASIRIAGTNQAAVTGTDGKFTLLIDSNKGKLLISYLGYQTQQVNVYYPGSMGTIMLQPNHYSLNETIVTGYTAQPKQNLFKKRLNADSGEEKTARAISQYKSLPGQAGIIAAKRNNSITAGNESNDKALTKNIVRGRIVGKDDGLPLIGATVKVNGTNISSVTDANGIFSLPADSSKTSLVIAYIGYNTREINLNNRESLKKITLEPNNASLNEVVVTGYSSRPKNDDATGAHPQTGWINYKKYLKENAVSPDSRKGVVKLTFRVNHDGDITDVKIVKGLSPATNQKAIDMLNNGPSWVGNANGVAEKVTLRVRFNK